MRSFNRKILNYQIENRPLPSWQRVSTLLMVAVSYVLGIVTLAVVLDWAYLNTIFKDNPLLFWFIGMIVAMTGLYISLRARLLPSVIKKHKQTRR